jgi:hypothetical protein
LLPNYGWQTGCFTQPPNSDSDTAHCMCAAPEEANN